MPEIIKTICSYGEIMTRAEYRKKYLNGYRDGKKFVKIATNSEIKLLIDYQNQSAILRNKLKEIDLSITKINICIMKRVEV